MSELESIGGRRDAIRQLAGIGTLLAMGQVRAAEKPIRSGMLERTIPRSGEALPVIGLGTYDAFDVGASQADRAPLGEVLEVLVEQLFVPTFRSLSAETMFTPGTVRSGLRRPSSVGPQLLKLAMLPAAVARWVAPTATTFLAVDGLPTVPVPGPELPAAKKSRKSLWSHMNWSASWLPAV